MLMKALSLIVFCLFSMSVYSADLTVDIKNIKKSKGTIKLVIFDSARGFPKNHNAAIDSAVLNIANLKASYTFKNLKSGTYAIAVFHDINNNDRLDTNMIGIPKEPFGFSNNPKILGPPKFNKCKFNVTADKTIQINLKKLF